MIAGADLHVNRNASEKSANYEQKPRPAKRGARTIVWAIFPRGLSIERVGEGEQGSWRSACKSAEAVQYFVLAYLLTLRAFLFSGGDAIQLAAHTGHG